VSVAARAGFAASERAVKPAADMLDPSQITANPAKSAQTNLALKTTR
jgi:hypothetical protein